MKHTNLKGTAEKSRLLRFCRWALVWMCMALFVLLAWMNLCHTAWTDSSLDNFGREFIDLRPDNLLLFFIVGPLLFALFRWAERAWDNLSTASLVRRICWTLFGVGAAWALLVDMSPRADQQTVLSISEQWLAGDFSSFEQGGYLFNFPYQTGIVAMLSIFGRLLGVGKYLPMQVANAGMIALTFWALYRICALMFPKDTGEGRAVLILSTGAWCGLMYSTFVYGNVPSLTLAVVSLWLQLRWQAEDRKISQLVLSGICLGFSVLLKTFSLIFVIAQGILLVLHMIRTHRKEALIWILAVLLAWQGVDGVLHLWARSKIGHPMNEGAPMIGTIAMGLQANEEGVRAPGWYNGYNIGVYETAGYDADRAAELAGENIRARLEEFRTDPEMARRFFYDKALSQWAEPTYQSFWITCSGDRPHWVEGLFVGPVNTVLVWIMNWFQSLVWVSAAGYLILRRRSLTLEQMLPGLVILGGFIFQLFWEGKGQYTLSYFMLALPYAAAGLHTAVNVFGRRSEKDEQKKKTENTAAPKKGKKKKGQTKSDSVKSRTANEQDNHSAVPKAERRVPEQDPLNTAIQRVPQKPPQEPPREEPQEKSQEEWSLRILQEQPTQPEQEMPVQSAWPFLDEALEQELPQEPPREEPQEESWEEWPLRPLQEHPRQPEQEMPVQPAWPFLDEPLCPRMPERFRAERPFPKSEPPRRPVPPDTKRHSGQPAESFEQTFDFGTKSPKPPAPAGQHPTKIHRTGHSGR